MIIDNLIIQTEDNIDFYKLLNEELDTESNNDDNMCLLTNLPLTLNHITLPVCKHKFNYLPLLKEVLRQKDINTNEIKTHNHYYGHNYNKVPYGYIKCPYCRRLSNGCLPYIPDLYNLKHTDVNYPLCNAIVQTFCKHIMINGKRKGQECGRIAYEVEENVFTCKVHKPKPPSLSNIVPPQTQNENILLCKSILKTGARAGQECGNKVKKDFTTCARHIPK